METTFSSRSGSRSSNDRTGLGTQWVFLRRRKSLHLSTDRQTFRVLILAFVLAAAALIVCPSVAAFVPNGKPNGCSNHPSMALRSPLLFHPMPRSRSPCISATENGNTNKNDDDDDGDGLSVVESLQDKLVYIQALEERNKAQIDSFVDEEDQWESMEEFERELLSSKEVIERQLNVLLAEE